MSDASDFLTKWVRKNVTPTTAHVRDDTLTAGRLAEECLWEAQGENLSEAGVKDAAGGNLVPYCRVFGKKCPWPMVSKLPSKAARLLNFVGSPLCGKRRFRSSAR
jgi:hypothetical protein